MFEQSAENSHLLDEQQEFDFFMQWDWPEHIETALRRLLWISLVEAAESSEMRSHTTLLRWMMATYPDSPTEVLDYLAQTGDTTLLVRIAENPQTSALTLSKLAKHDDAQVRIAVADNVHAPINTVLELASDGDLDVRYSMAENPGLPAKMLQKLAQDDNVYIASRAAKTMMRRNPASVQHLPTRSVDSERKAM